MAKRTKAKKKATLQERVDAAVSAAVDRAIDALDGVEFAPVARSIKSGAQRRAALAAQSQPEGSAS